MPAPTPPFPPSKLVRRVEFGKHRLHKADGDMWPITWAADGHLYGAAGDNMGSPMNFWRIEGDPPGHSCWLVDNLPIDPQKYCDIPPAHPQLGVKPAGLLSLGGVLYLAVEAMNYGDNPAFNRQRNIHGWIITSADGGKTWNRQATPTHFFTGRLSSCHFIQFGQDHAGARDEYVHANFPIGDDGGSYWENGDGILLGRVPTDQILRRQAWEFWTGQDAAGKPQWNPDDSKAKPVFHWPRMTGENHIVYNAGIRRFIMGNYAFMDEQGNPRPYHQLKWPQSVYPSQLTLLEAPNPWGPWSLLHRDDNWGTYGDYQPNFPTKWMSPDGLTMWMVSSGTFDDYNFTCQQVTLHIA